MNWIILTIAGCFEVLFTFCMGKVKETTGTEMYLWFTGFLIATFISMLLLVKATQNLPIGTAYAVWTGIGAVGTVLVGILVFREPASFWRLFFIVMLISSIIGLKMVSHWGGSSSPQHLRQFRQRTDHQILLPRRMNLLVFPHRLSRHVNSLPTQ